MSVRQRRHLFEDAWLAVLLAGVAGSVDAIGYLTLSKLFTAHMSGNSAAMGAFVGIGEWANARHRLLPIPFFVLGIATGAFLAELAVRKRVRSPFALVLTGQAALLLLYLLWGSARMRHGTVAEGSWWEFAALVGLPSFAMGLQNATLRKVGSQSVRTTYVSGMLTDFAEALVRLLFWLYGRAWGRSPRRVGQALRVLARQPDARRIGLFAGIWGAFVIGAAAGGCAVARWQLDALLLPLCGLGVVIGVDSKWPIVSEQKGKRARKGRDGNNAGKIDP